MFVDLLHLLIAVLLPDYPKCVHGQDVHRKSCRKYVKDEVLDYEYEVLVKL